MVIVYACYLEDWHMSAAARRTNSVNHKSHRITQDTETEKLLDCFSF